jgi:polyvinyl alcohol dehydrogenase (cytochrome)
MRSTAHAGCCALAACLTMGVSLAQTDTPAAIAPAPEKNPCPMRADPVALGTALWNGWGRDIDNSRYQPEPALRASDVEKLKLKWAYGYQGGAGLGQPTIVDGRVFTTSSTGRVYSIDAKSGCTFWTFDAAVGSRTAISIAELGQSKRAAIPKRLKRSLAHLDVIKAPAAVLFGDDSGAVYALDAQRGTLLWKTQVESHPLARISGAPTLYNDRLYVSMASTEDVQAAIPGYACCTFRGSIAALDVASGKILWKTFTVLEEPVATRKSAQGVQEFAPAGAAVATAPTIDAKRRLLYVGTGPSMTSVEQSLTDAIAAFDLDDGKLRWVKQLTRSGELPLSSFLSSPVLRTLSTGNQIILAGQKSGVVYGLDPDHGGEILWQTHLGGLAGGAATASSGSGGIAFGLAADHRNVYAALTGTLAQPANDSGSLTALDLKTGIARWHVATPPVTCSWTQGPCLHGGSQAVSVMPGSAFEGSLDGHLRAYSTIEGKVQWDFDAAKNLPTLNGIMARGGALDRGGTTIVNGAVYVNSGNALLVFTVDGQ